MPLLLASTLLRQLRSNMRRSLGQRAVAVYGVCLLLLVAIVVFAASSPISVLVVLGMLWALGHEQRPDAQPSRTSLARVLEPDEKADEARERLQLGSNDNRNDEEGSWMSDS